MTKVIFNLMFSLLAVVTFTGCDIVVKVNKKSKDGSDSTLNGNKDVQTEQNAGLGPDYLKDLDSLKKIALEVLLNELKGKDFRLELRKAVRKFRESLISAANKPIKESQLSVDQEEICKDGIINLNLKKANKHLGIILKAAVLAKLGEEHAKALNAKIADDSKAIGQLILKEIGLDVKGDTVVTRDGETVTTEGDFSLKLLPFDEDDDTTKAKDAAEILTLKFKRVADKHDEGSFTATIGVTELTDSNATIKHYMTLAANASETDGKKKYEASMTVGSENQEPRYSHSLTVMELGGKKYQIIDKLTVAGKDTKIKESIIDLNDSKCKFELEEEKHEKGQEVESSPASNSNDNQGESSSSNDNTSKAAITTDNNDKGTESDDKDSVVNDPAQNPGQSPAQSK